MNANEYDSVQCLLDAGAAQSAPTVAQTPGPNDSVPYVVVPNHYKVESLEKLLPTPSRKKAIVTLSEVQSFARYIEAHQTADTALFMNVNGRQIQFKACIDYHSPKPGGAANWREHVALYAPKISLELDRWDQWHGQWLDQERFAEFLQDNQVDVVTPDGATLLEIVSVFTAKKDHDFTSAVNLANGAVQFQYIETVKSGCGEKRTLEMPRTFMLKLPVFDDGTRYPVEARLRYRLDPNEHTVAFRYDLLRLEDTVKTAHNEQVSAVKTATKLEPFVGNYS